MTEQRIFRGRHTSRFTALPNEIWDNEALCLEAKGLLGHLLSRPPNWHVRLKQLGKKHGIGRDRLRKLINELISAGYVVREQPRRDGAFDTIRYFVRDVVPQPENPAPVKPVPVEPAPVNQAALLKQNLTNTDSIKTSSASKRTLSPIRAERAAPPKRLGKEGVKRPDSPSVVQARLATRFGVGNVEAGWLLLGELSQEELASLTEQERAGRLSDQTLFDIAVRLGEKARKAALPLFDQANVSPISATVGDGGAP